MRRSTDTSTPPGQSLHVSRIDRIWKQEESSKHAQEHRHISRKQASWNAHGHIRDILVEQEQDKKSVADPGFSRWGCQPLRRRQHTI